MTIRTQTITAPNQIVVRNRLDVKQQIVDAVKVDPWVRVEVDLGTCAYIDSSGLAVLVTASRYQTRNTHHGLPLVLSNLTPDIATLFELTKLADLFDIKEAV